MLPYDDIDGYIKEISYNDFLASAEVIKRVCESCRNCNDCYYFDDHVGCQIRSVIDPDNEDSVSPCHWILPNYGTDMRKEGEAK